MPDYDAIVIGAGIAGATAAYHLGEAGCRVLVLEKASLPRYKACAGGVPKSVLASFPFSLASVIEREISCVRFALRGDDEVEHPLGGKPVAMVMRAKLDFAVAQQAKATIHDATSVVGLEEEDTRVTVSTSRGDRFAGRYVVGADGAHSIVSKSIWPRRQRHSGIALEAEVPVDNALLSRYKDTALFELGSIRDGYDWIFPKMDRLSVGIGSFGESRPNLAKTLRREMSKWGIELDGVRIHGHPLPVYTSHERLHSRRCLLVGDAGNLMDPLLGEGIRHAVHSGRLAAQAIISDALPGYSVRVRAEIGRSLRVAHWMARLFYRFTEPCYRRGIKDKRFVLAFVGMFAGEYGYPGLIRRFATNVSPRMMG